MNAGNKLPIIKFLTGPLAGRTFVISKPTTTIGRDPTNDIVVGSDQKVSRHHARLLWNDGKWSIENVSQSVALTVDQRNTQRAIIQDNTVIGLGADTSFVFLAQVETPIQQSGATEAPTVIRPQGDHKGPLPATTPPPPLQTSEQVFPAPPPALSTTAPLRNTALQASGPGQTQIASFTALGLPSLVLSSNAHSDKKAYILDKPIINIGRDATNDIIINDRIVSGLHLRVVRRGNQFVLVHPNPDNPRQRTLNGLLYQGRKIRGDEQFSKTLANGDIFRIGDESGTLITLTYSDGSGAQQDMLPPVQPIKLTGASSSPGGATEITIGREADNKVVLSHPQVSAHHARLVREGGTYRILDLNSTNHVYVNSELATSLLL